MSIKNQVESLLFISNKPLTISELAKLVISSAPEVKKFLAELADEYRQRAGGIQLLQVGDKYQLAASSDSSAVVKKFIKSELTGELTRPSLEALTVIAYRGPISKAELELIRGVNCGLILRNLLIRGLIETKENKKQNIILYSITFDFLKYLGINRPEELPDYERLNRNNNLEKLLSGASNNGKLAVSG